MKKEIDSEFKEKVKKILIDDFENHCDFLGEESGSEMYSDWCDQVLDFPSNKMFEVLEWIKKETIDDNELFDRYMGTIESLISDMEIE